MKNSNAQTGNEPACVAERQTTAPPIPLRAHAKQASGSFRFVVCSINAAKDLFQFKDIKT